MHNFGGFQVIYLARGIPRTNSVYFNLVNISLQMFTDKRQLNYCFKVLFIHKDIHIPVKSSKVDEFKNDRQMFAFLAAE